MFMEKANATFNAWQFNCTMIRTMSDDQNINAQVRRLYLAAKQLRSIEKKAAVANLLNISPQNLNGWEARGISEGGLLKAQEVIGCDAIWLRDGTGDMVRGGGSARPGPDIDEIAELISLFGKSNAEGRKAILDMARATARLADLSRSSAIDKFQ